MNVKGKIIVVTGAGSGMGRELTIQLVQKGAKVAMVDLNETTLKQTADLVGIEHVSSHILNISDQKLIEKLPEAIIERHGSVDALINNAGIIQPFVDVKDLTSDIIERIMMVNFYGTVHMTRAFLPLLLKRPEAHVANVSSMGGFIPFPGQTIYGASKAAIKIFTEGLYAELKQTNIGVTVIFPGAVNTNIMTNSGIENSGSADASQESNAALAADKAASIIIRAIEKNKFRVLVGKDAKILDFLYRLNPRMAVNIITKQMAKYKQ
jgi:short-subunit dehydrogenase